MRRRRFSAITCTFEKCRLVSRAIFGKVQSQMAEEQNDRERNEATNKAGGGVSNGFLLLMFVGGWIAFGFGAVGLYEDREFVSFDSVLAVVGLILVVLSFRVILSTAKTSEEGSGYSLGGGVCLLIWGCIRLALRILNDKPWWDQGISVLIIGAGIIGIIAALGEKNDPDADDEPGSEE